MVALLRLFLSWAVLQLEELDCLAEEEEEELDCLACRWPAGSTSIWNDAICALPPTPRHK